jgi:hypothetical protein
MGQSIRKEEKIQLDEKGKEEKKNTKRPGEGTVNNLAKEE